MGNKDFSPTTYNSLTVIHCFRFDVFVGDPCDEEAKPIFRGFENRDADACGAINRRRNACDTRCNFSRLSVGAVCAQVELVARLNILVKVKERQRWIRRPFRSARSTSRRRWCVLKRRWAGVAPCAKRSVYRRGASASSMRLGVGVPSGFTRGKRGLRAF